MPEGTYIDEGSFSTDNAPKEELQTNDIAHVQSLELPQSIYSCLPTLLMMNVDIEAEWSEHMFLFILLLPYIGLLYFTVACQVAVIYFVSDIVTDQAVDGMNVDCSQAPHILQLVGVFCFSTLVLTDLKESVAMMQYFAALPRSSPWLGIDYFTVDSQGKADGFGKRQAVNTPFVWAMNVLIIAPKVAVACGIWWTGTAFLLGAPSSEELLLNAVALVFVLEIDDYIYHGVVPEPLKAHIETFPPITQSEDEANDSHFGTFWELWSMFGVHFLFSLVIGVTYGSKAWHCIDVDVLQNASGMDGSGDGGF